MHGCHEMYLNLKGADHLDYAAYLQRCSELAAIDKSVASTTQYRSYVNAMCAYFIDYLKRTQPLMPLAELLAKAEFDFAARWDAGEITRWQGASAAAEAATAVEVDIEAAGSAEEFEALGLETLKGLLTQRGLKCGGSLKDRAARLYMLKGKTLADIPKKHRDMVKVSEAAETSASVTLPLSFSRPEARFLRSKSFLRSGSKWSLVITTLEGWMPSMTVAPLFFSLLILSTWMTYFLL